MKQKRFVSFLQKLKREKRKAAKLWKDAARIEREYVRKNGKSADDAVIYAVYERAQAYFTINAIIMMYQSHDSKTGYIKT